MRTASIIINAIIFVTTLIILIFCFRKDGTWQIRPGLKAFRFFTVLSNALCAIAALMMAVSQLGGAVLHVFGGALVEREGRGGAYDR